MQFYSLIWITFNFNFCLIYILVYQTLPFSGEEIPFKTLIYIDWYGVKINTEIHSSV